MVSTVIRSVAIPRLDRDGYGVQLAWSGPELTPLAAGGYEVWRRKVRKGERGRTCAHFDRARLAQLEQLGFLPDELGTILCRRGAFPGRRLAPDAHEVLHEAVATAPVAVLARSSQTLVYVFTQELAQPTARVWVEVDGRAAWAIALAGGKAVAVQELAGGTTAELDGQDIDTVVVYAASPSALTICAGLPPTDAQLKREWAQAELLADRLTLPLVECDPGLADDAGEVDAMRSRLIGPETLDGDEADRLRAALRAAASRDDLGRPCDRVMLTRTATDEPWQETLFTSRIALLTLDPRWRRVLGFGFADRTAQEGETYDYMIRGRFPAADLDDRVDDVHGIPSGTAIPAVVRLGDVQLRFAQPTTIVLDPPPDPGALEDVSRRGLRIEQPGDGNPLGWLGLGTLYDLACVIELPEPVSELVLEVAPGHDLRYEAANPGDPYNNAGDPLPDGPRAELSFRTPVTQLRLRGSGTLHGIRRPATGPGTGGERLLHAENDDITFAARPLPDRPAALLAANLQTPPSVLTGPLGEQTRLPARPQPGFRLTWVPATDSPTAIWPDDLAAGPPLQAIAYNIEHRRVWPGPPPSGGGHAPDPWDRLHAGDNLTFAAWPASPSAQPLLGFNVDLEAAFPLHPPHPAGTALTMSATDVFGVVDPETGEARPDPPLGSLHEYRIRAVDIVGRTSDRWTPAPRARLEKHLPPPLPVGPQPAPVPTGDPPRLNGPTGVRARPILASDPGLSAADEALLAGHASAIVLDWGWRDAERALDPTTQEFRVYLLDQVPTEVPCAIGSATASGSEWLVEITTDRVLVADECAGQWLTSGGRTFRILGHDAGSAPQLRVAANRVRPSDGPLPGAANFGRPLHPDHQRPAFWTARVAVVPLTSAESYRYIFHDGVNVTATQRRRQLWVGVSAADAESYIPDELPSAAANGGRPGNESSIAAVTVDARYRGRPAFSVPPPLGDIPEQVTDEPTGGRPLNVALDAAALLGGGVLPAGARVALDRCPADAILAIARADGANVTLARRDGTKQTVAFPNPGDEAAVLAALGSTHPEQLAGRYLMYLLGHFDRPTELLTRVTGDLAPATAATDRVDPRPGRWFYRVRLADDAGAVSEDGAILPVVVRVPSMAPAPAPRRVELHATAPDRLTFTVAVEPDPELRWLLVFAHAGAWADGPPAADGAQLLRIPNRRDLYPGDGLRLRLADGTIVAPALAKAVADADVTVAADGTRTAALAVPVALLPSPAQAPFYAQCWCWALSRDGVPSRPLGPFTQGLPSA
jgi:hypothetical protein